MSGHLAPNLPLRRVVAVTLPGREAAPRAAPPTVPGYRIGEQLGGGGMGVVYRAEQIALDRPVAIKLLQPHLRSDPRVHQRFLNEARAASRLNHPNSVAIIDFGVSGEQVPYLVMEYLDGADLAAFLENDGPLAPERVCGIALQVLGALGEAHALGIVHRDLKPENIFVARRREGAIETVKVVDFGLAQVAMGTGGRCTEPGFALGTPQYMAPEQFGDAPVDGRADLYAVGAVLFELLTGRAPFLGTTPMALARQHFLSPPPDARLAAPDSSIEEGLARLIQRAMAKAPDERFETAEAMAAAVREAADRLSQGRSSAAPRCAACGARLRHASDACSRCTARRALVQEPRLTSALAELEAWVSCLDGGPVSVGVEGGAGAGKTTLLYRFAERARRLGCSVASGEAHPLRAPVPYHPIRLAMTSVIRDAISAVGGGPAGDAEDGGGLSELLSPAPGGGEPTADRATVVAMALAAALRAGAARAPERAVVLLLDDVDEYDDVSLRVLRELPAALGAARVLIVAAGSESRTIGERLRLERRLSLEPPAGEISPLHRRLLGGASARTTMPVPRVPEAVAHAVDRLDPGARSLLQAIAVLGERAPDAAAAAVAGATAPASVDGLLRAGLVEERRDGETRIHALVRELVEGSTPAEVRRTLHDRALAWHEEHGSPIEVRAEHALRGSDPELALLLLDQVGQIAQRRGDLRAATHAYRRALELSRRERSLSGDEQFGRAVVSFSRSLADALRAGGNDAEADGVLDEAADAAPPGSRQHAEMMVVLARIALRKGQLARALVAARKAARADLSKLEPDLYAEAEGLAQQAQQRLADGAPREPPRPPRPSSAASAAPAVLVVEDHRETQEGLRHALEDEGYQVHCASNGDHALRVLARIPRPCGILVDLMMPVMNGWDLLGALRESSAYADIPVVVISAVAQRGPADARRLTKPISLETLLETVGRFRSAAAPEPVVVAERVEPTP